MATIIVIDDDYATTTLVKMLLEMEGYQALAKTTVDSALADIGANSSVVAALIIDCNLANNESGVEFLDAVRRGETILATDVPAILVSGDHRLEKEAVAVGANLFMLKPYSPNELTSQVKRLALAES